MTFAVDIRQWRTVAQFEAHLSNYAPSVAPWAKGVTIHHTEVPTIAQWRGRASVKAAAVYYEHTRKWDAGPHLFICAGAPDPDDDGIFQLTPLNLPGIHAGSCNATMWGMEVVGDYDLRGWSPATAELVYGACAALFEWQRFVVSANTLKGHRECLPNKTCPGKAIDMNVVRATLAALLFTTPATPAYTASTPILGTARIPLSRWISAFTNHEHGAYTPADIATILTEYDKQSTRLGINRDVALAQLAHETDWLSSWWSQRPRRNGAGIGVNGEISRSRPDGGEWVRRDDGFWTRGQSFSNWQTGSIPAHLGRLLAYALPDGGGTRMQQDVMGYALGVRGLPEDFRGAAPTLQGLDGKWAPRKGYGQSVADRANEVAG